MRESVHLRGIILADIEDLRSLDSEDRPPILAIHLIGASKRDSNTLASPLLFDCEDGEKYWVKWKSQNGLFAELIGGRLAGLVGAGPTAEVIEVPEDVFGLTGNQKNFEGIRVGLVDVPNTINSKKATQHISGDSLSQLLDAPSRARCVVFQTWLDVGDTQTLINMKNGTVAAIDHGAAFAALGNPDKFSVRVARIGGVTEGVGKDRRYAIPAVDDIERLDERDILKAVANVPDGDMWKITTEDRFQIFEWLMYRKEHLREVMERWLSA